MLNMIVCSENRCREKGKEVVVTHSMGLSRALYLYLEGDGLLSVARSTACDCVKGSTLSSTIYLFPISARYRTLSLRKLDISIRALLSFVVFRAPGWCWPLRLCFAAECASVRRPEHRYGAGSIEKRRHEKAFSFAGHRWKSACLLHLYRRPSVYQLPQHPNASSE